MNRLTGQIKCGRTFGGGGIGPGGIKQMAPAAGKGGQHRPHRTAAIDKDIKHDSRKRSGLLITHLGYILNFVSADKAHVLMDGKIACSGNPAEIIEDIRKEGFNGCVECAQCIK